MLRQALLTIAIALSPGISFADPEAAPRAGPPPIHAIEQAIESRADTLVLPTTTPGNLVVTQCTAAGCVPVSLVATERSRFFIGRSQVALEDFRREVASRPSAGVVVLYDARSRDLTRILMSAPPKAGAG